MSAAALGFVASTPVSTPGGARPIAEVSVGDAVHAWSESSGALVVVSVVETRVCRANGLYRLLGDGAEVAGCTAGTYVWDASEDMFRGAGSLSSLTELLVTDGRGVRRVALDDALEVGGEADVHHLRVDGDEGCWFAGGVLVRHFGDRR
jgi:hypothetical protein